MPRFDRRPPRRQSRRPRDGRDPRGDRGNRRFGAPVPEGREGVGQDERPRGRYPHPRRQPPRGQRTERREEHGARQETQDGAAHRHPPQEGYRTQPPLRPHPGKPQRTPSHLQRRPGTDYLYGINPISRALEVGRRKLFRLWLREGRLSDALEGLRTAMTVHGLPVGEASVADLSELAGTDSHQGAVLECGPLALGSEDEALALLQAPSGVPGSPGPGPADLPLLVVLDQVEDPQNFGAIVRSCAVFGATAAIVPRHHAAPASPAASKASAGELEAFPVFEAANLSRFLDACKERGAWTAAALTEGGDALGSFKRDTPLVLVMGNEGRGVRPLVEKHCDFKLTIPTQPDKSLNVSAATAVVLYALTTSALVPRPGILAPPPRPEEEETQVV